LSRHENLAWFDGKGGATRRQTVAARTNDWPRTRDISVRKNPGRRVEFPFLDAAPGTGFDNWAAA
jgi:hypothetical protein